MSNTDLRHADHGGGLYGLAGVAAVATAVVVAGAVLGRRQQAPRPADSAPRRTRRGRTKFHGYDVVGRTVTIGRPRSEVYAAWRDFENLPRFMENVRAVRVTGANRSVWTIAAPAGFSVEIETELTIDEPDEYLAWRSVEGSDIDTEGSVTFRDAPGKRGTEVEAVIAYRAPGGQLGRAIAALYQKEPAIQGRRELKRLKMLLETGEIANSRNNRKASGRK